jgi:hypothetical protein
MLNSSKTNIKRENEDLKRQIESMSYDLDFMIQIKEERDECYVSIRNALCVLENIAYGNIVDESNLSSIIKELKGKLK